MSDANAPIWHPWVRESAEAPSPYDYAEALLQRGGVDYPAPVDPFRLPAETNVAGLFWRPSGPAPSQAKAAGLLIPFADKVRAQVTSPES